MLDSAFSFLFLFSGYSLNKLAIANRPNFWLQAKGRIQSNNFVTLQPLQRPNSQFAPNSVSQY